MNTRIDHVMFWLEHGGTAIRTHPGSKQDGVHHWTHPNCTGGLAGWHSQIHDVYFSPSSLDERLLQAQVHEVMACALEWALRDADIKTPYAPWQEWSCLHLAEAYRIARMVALVDPMRACGLKIHLNKLCSRTGRSLSELVSINFGVFIPETELHW